MTADKTWGKQFLVPSLWNVTFRTRKQYYQILFKKSTCWVKMSRHAFAVWIQYITEVPSKWCWTPMRNIEVFTISRQLQIHLWQQTVHSSCQWSIRKCCTVSSKAGTLIEILYFLSAKNKYSFWHTKKK